MFANTSQMAEAFSFMADKDKPIVHRDFKLDNVCLSEAKGDCRLVDLGFAREYEAEGSFAEHGSFHIISGSPVPALVRHEGTLSCPHSAGNLLECTYDRRHLTGYINVFHLNSGKNT